MTEQTGPRKIEPAQADKARKWIADAQDAMRMDHPREAAYWLRLAAAALERTA